MGKPLSNEKRADIVKHMQAGESKENIAKWMFITVRTINRVWKRYQDTGNSDALPNRGGRKPLVTEETMGEVVLKIKEIPDITLRELIETFELALSESALCRRLNKLDLTFKKRHFILMDESVKML